MLTLPSKSRLAFTVIGIAAGLVFFSQRRAAMEMHVATITGIKPLNSKCGSLKWRRVFCNCTRFQAHVTYPIAGTDASQAGKVIVAELDGHGQSAQSKGVPRIGDRVKVYVDRAAGTLEADIGRPNRVYWILG